jgi:hypothetical protein
MNWLTIPEEFGISMAADIATSIIAAGGCFAILWWIARTPGRSILEERSVPLLITLGAIYTLRCFSWVQDEYSNARWLAFWPSTLLPIVMTIFVEGLLRRHVPFWLKVWSLFATASMIGLHMIPRFDLDQAYNWWWPTGVTVTMALLARQMWVMRNAGLARQEQRLILGVVVAVIIAMPLVATDSGRWLGALSIRLGGVGGLLFMRALVTPVGGDGLRDAVAGAGRATLRALLISLIVFVVLPTAGSPEFIVAFDISLALILLFEIIDRLRRRRRGELETQLMHWLAIAPTGDFEAWRRSIRHAPLVGDAIVIEGKSLAHYDAMSLAAALERHGPIVTTPALRSTLANATASDLEGLEQAIDLLTVHDVTHAGLISTSPLRILAANLPYVGGQDTEMQLRVILRTGQTAAGAAT